MKFLSYPINILKMFLKPSSTFMFFVFCTLILTRAFTLSETSAGTLSSQTVWDSVDFWRRLHMSAYLIVIIWSCFSLLSYSISGAVYLTAILLEFFLPDSALRDYAHQIFVYLDIYKLFGYNSGSATNPNAAWIAILLLLSIALFVRLLTQLISPKNRSTKARFLFFPFAAATSILLLTLIMHETIIGGMLGESKSICASDTEAILQEPDIFTANCISKDQDCAKITANDQGVTKINILHKQHRPIALSMNDPSGDHPSDRNENQIRDILTMEGTSSLHSQTNYNWRVNGFAVYSVCGIKLDSKNALISIDTHEFSLRFSQAQMRFHRLVSISSWVWLVVLMLHSLLRPKKLIV